MRWRNACLIAPIALCAVQGVIGAAAQGASYSVDTLTFGSAQVAFPTNTITFSNDRVDLPTDWVRTETPATIEVTLPADILFDFDKADIRPTAQDALREVARLLREKGRGPVTIQGYTDALGTDAYNQRLSERRAAAVKVWFQAHEGLASMPFTTAGFGARNPVAPNRKPDGSDDPEGRQLNRRVTLIIRK